MFTFHGNSRHRLDCGVAPGAGLVIGADGADAQPLFGAAGETVHHRAGFAGGHFLNPTRRRDRVDVVTNSGSGSSDIIDPEPSGWLVLSFQMRRDRNVPGAPKVHGARKQPWLERLQTIGALAMGHEAFGSRSGFRDSALLKERSR